MMVPGSLRPYVHKGLLPQPIHVQPQRRRAGARACATAAGRAACSLRLLAL